MTSSREVENPTPEKIAKVKQYYANLGYIFVGEANTGMHLENSNSYMKSNPIITLYFEKR